MTVIPEAPWWANMLLVIIVAMIAILPALKASRTAKVVAERAHHTSARTEGQLERVLHNVENSHNIGLRDDLDQKIDRAVESVETVGLMVTVLHDDVKNLHTSVDGVHHELRNVQESERSISQRLLALERGEVVAAVVHAVADTSPADAATLET